MKNNSKFLKKVHKFPLNSNFFITNFPSQGDVKLQLDTQTDDNQISHCSNKTFPISHRVTDFLSNLLRSSAFLVIKIVFPSTQRALCHQQNVHSYRSSQLM